MTRTIPIAAAALPLVAAGLVGVSSAPAQAACGHSWSNKDSGGSSVIWSDPQPKFRTGPHDYCSLVNWLPGGTDVYYHCFTTNEAGHTWTHARRAGTDIQGWIYDGYLSDGGSNRPC
jgi:hypothetical protein